MLNGDPRNAPAQVLLSDIDGSQGNVVKALEEAQLAITFDPGRATSYVNLAILQQRNNDLPSSERSLQKALTIDPKSLLASALRFGKLISKPKTLACRRKAVPVFYRAGSTESATARDSWPRATWRRDRRTKAEQVLSDAKASILRQSRRLSLTRRFLF